jgi:hypothetical protein
MWLFAGPFDTITLMIHHRIHNLKGFARIYLFPTFSLTLKDVDFIELGADAF